MRTAPGTLLRTVRHLHPRQVWHHALHVLLPAARSAEPPPDLPAPALQRAAAPFPGAPAHAHFEPPDRVTLLNREARFDGRIDWDIQSEGPLFAFHLHQHDFLRAASLSPSDRSAVLLDWESRHRRGTGWHPASISLRALTWLKLLTTPGALEEDAGELLRVRRSLSAQLEMLAGHLEVRLLANHYLSNLLALVAGGLVLRGGAARRWLGLVPELCSQLEKQVLADGAHYERSPMYHALMLEGVLDVLNWARAAGERAPGGLVETLEGNASRMLAALAIYTHPDGEIALFADSAFGIAQRPEVLEAYAGSLGVLAAAPARAGVLEDAGYVRLADGAFSLLVSVAGPKPAYQPGHAHADALAFELCVNGERVVTDTGVFEYVPGERRDRARATSSHATIEVGGRDQAELWAAHRVGGRPKVKLEAVGPGRRVEASCAGWATRDTPHRRVLALADGVLEITDTLADRRHALKLVLPLAPGLEPALEGSEALLPGLRIALPGAARWRIERCEYYPEFGRSVERAVLVGDAEGEGPFLWRFRASD